MHKNIRRTTLTAMFVAITLILGLTPLGIIPLGFINVTILHIPVIIATLALGQRTGFVLGLCFAATSVLRAFGIPFPASVFVATLLGENPLTVVIMSVIPRVLMPLSTAYAYRAMQRVNKNPYLSLSVAAVAGTLTNTVLYLGLMLLFYALTGLDTASVIALIVGTGIFAGISESVAAALLATPVVLALRKSQKLQ